MGDRITAPEPPRPALDGSSLVAALAVLLARYTDRPDIAVGYVEEGQELRAVKLTVDPDATFPDLVARVNGVLAGPRSRRSGRARRSTWSWPSITSPPRERHDSPWLLAHRAARICVLFPAARAARR